MTLGGFVAIEEGGGWTTRRVDEIAFAVPRHGPVGDFGRTGTQKHHVAQLAPAVDPMMGPPTGPAAAEVAGQLLPHPPPRAWTNSDR